jgi:DNA-binding PadR family transcriptional regulator
MPTLEPLSPPVFHILLALTREDRHGYGIIKDVLARTDGALRLGAGTLYGCIKRMLEAGLIEEAGERTEPGDERRKYYRITAHGQRAAHTEAQRLERLVRDARDRRVLPELEVAR